jgi:hypothetical protein
MEVRADEGEIPIPMLPDSAGSIGFTGVSPSEYTSSQSSAVAAKQQSTDEMIGAVNAR